MYMHLITEFNIYNIQIINVQYTNNTNIQIINDGTMVGSSGFYQ